MLKFRTVSLIIATLAGLLTLAACDRSKEEEASVSALASTESMLRYVPADSLYVIANVEPLPDALLDKLEPKLDQVLSSYRVLLQHVAVMAAAEAGEDAADSPEVSQLTAIADELSALMSLDGLRSAGFSRDSTAVMYGNGLLPVIRVSVTDGGLFDAALSRIEEKAGQKMPVASIGESAFRYLQAGTLKVIVANFDTEVVLAAAPASFDDEQLSQLLGLTLPDSSIAETGALQKIANEYGYTDHYVGFVDFQGIVNTVLGGEASGLNADLVALAGDESPELSDVCKAEILSLAGIAPRLVMGYTEITDQQLLSGAVIELRDDIAAGLVPLTAAVPGLGEEYAGLMSFGMSLDIKAARSFYEARLDALDAEPFECELFQEIQAGVVAGRQALNQPVPPMVYDFKGFLAVIDKIEGLDLASNMPPKSVAGRFLLAMDNATALMSLGAMFSPELAALNLEPDGKPARFESPQLQSAFDAVYLAMSDNAVAMSVGDDMDQQLPDMLAAEAEDNGILLSFSMDASRYYAFIAEAMLVAKEDDENPMPPEFQGALNDIMLAFSDFYDRMSARIRLTGRGVEIDSKITIKD
ncbi:hypothetical protein GWP57_06575 [Gammaproteobacteria bacterium]|jgi:hypothetical protein|nr:hypothetical protein [Gammaproteobacteria bacterium]